MGRIHWTRQLALVPCALALCWSCALPASADEVPAQPENPAGTAEPPSVDDSLSQPGEDPEEEEPPQPGDEPEENPGEGETPETPPVESYTVTLSDCSIGEGEMYGYTTISSSFAGEEIPEGYYPGALTVEISGRIVVEAGGSLDIGTLSIDGPEEHPVLTGSGQIMVKAGGSLRLTCVSVDGTGEGPMIIQEPGGSVVLQDTEAEDGLVQWSAPMVDNRHDQPDDLWLEAGTTLTMEMLPEVLEVDVQDHGLEEEQAIPVAWDLSTYDGRTEGELTLTGSFLGSDGQPLLSMEPLELIVHWYTLQTLAVTDAVWKGDTVPTVQLTVQNLPEFADVWGEVSTDGGETWTRWEDPDTFFIVTEESGDSVCVFQLPDETPGWFRIAAEDPWEHLYWRSDSFYLCYEDQDDSGGNRGGSVTPGTPDREPTPPEDDVLLELKPPLEPEEPEVSPEEPDTAGTATADPETVEDTPAVSSQQPEEPASPDAPETSSEPSVPADTEEGDDTALTEQTELTVASQTEEPQEAEDGAAESAELPAENAQQKKSALPTAVQGLLVTAGIAVSVTAALAAARVGPFRRKS